MNCNKYQHRINFKYNFNEPMLFLIRRLNYSFLLLCFQHDDVSKGSKPNLNNLKLKLINRFINRKNVYLHH